jgi:hypothetical protein
MNMEVDKQKFRDLIESDQVGQALNQLSDISHFLGQGGLQEELQSLAKQYQKLEEMAEDAEGREALKLDVKNGLLDLVEQLPEEFSPEEAGREGSPGGCLGMITLLALGLLYFLSSM